MRVLIVDDSKAMRMIVKRTLRSAGFTGLDVSEAGDGAEALSAIQKSPPDVVLTDWNMPNLNGIELVRKLKEQNSPVTIGVVTSESSAEMRDEAVAAGAAFFITKPFTAETFGQALDGLLGQAGAGSSDGATTQAQSAVPDVSGLRTALARLVPRNVDVAQAKSKASEKGTVVARYHDADGALGAVAFADLSSTACFGAALTLIPAGAVKDAVRGGELPQNMRDNANEVFNVIGSLMSGVKLAEVIFEGGDVQGDVKGKISSAAHRLDVQVEITGYPPGTLSIVR